MYVYLPIAKQKNGPKRRLFLFELEAVKRFVRVAGVSPATVAENTRRSPALACTKTWTSCVDSEAWKSWRDRVATVVATLRF